MRLSCMDSCQLRSENFGNKRLSKVAGISAGTCVVSAASRQSRQEEVGSLLSSGLGESSTRRHSSVSPAESTVVMRTPGRQSDPGWVDAAGQCFDLSRSAGVVEAVHFTLVFDIGPPKLLL